MNFKAGNFNVGGNFKIAEVKKEDQTKKKVVLVTTTSVPIDFDKGLKQKGQIKVWKEDIGKEKSNKAKGIMKEYTNEKKIFV